MFAKRQSDPNSESESDNESKDRALVKRKSQGGYGYNNSADTKLEMSLSVKAVINKIEQAKLLRAKEAILSQLIEIMSKVELIMTRYFIDSTSPGKRGSLPENQRKKRKIFLEKIAAYVKSIDIREKILIKLLSWLEEWNFVLSEVAEIDVDEYHHWIAQMELLPETLKEMDSNVNTLCQITTLLLEEKKRQKKKFHTRGTLWKAWKERVVKRPAAGHALRPDQMICDQLALNTKVSEIQDMLQELISSAMLTKLENNAIKYISATVLNLSKALCMVNDELKLVTFQVTHVGIDEEREMEKVSFQKIFQELSKENEMLHQKLRDCEEKCDQLIRIKNFLGRQLLVPTTSLRMLVVRSPQAPVSKDADAGEIDSLLNKELEKIIDESQTKGVRATAIKWDSSMTYLAQDEMAPDGAKQQAEDKADQDQKRQYPMVPLPAETSDTNLEKEKVMEVVLGQFSDLQALDMKRKDGKSFLEGKPQGLDARSGASSMWLRLKKGRSEHSLGKSPVSSEIKIAPPVKPTDKEAKTEVEQTKSSQPERTPEPPKTETKGKKPVPEKTEEMPAIAKQQHGKLQPKAPKQTSVTPDARSEKDNLESFQKAILAFLREKTSNVGKAFDPKSIQEEEKSLGRAEVEKLYLVKSKMEEYVQKVAETVTRTVRTYKEARKEQLRGKFTKQQKTTTTSALPQLLARQGFVSSTKSDIISFLLSEMTDPVIRALTQTLLDELESERDSVPVSTAGQDHKDKRQDWPKWAEEAWKEEQRLQKQAEQKHRARERELEEPGVSEAQDLSGREDTDREKAKAVRDAEDGQRPKESKTKLPAKTESKPKDLLKTFTQSAVVLSPRWMKTTKPQTSQVQLFQMDTRALESPDEKRPSSPRTLLDSAKPFPVPAPEKAQIVGPKVSQIPMISLTLEQAQVLGGPPIHEPVTEVQIPPPTAKQEQELGTQLMAPRIFQQTLTPRRSFLSEKPQAMQIPQTTAEQAQMSGVTVTQRAVLPLQQIQVKDITLPSQQALDQGIVPTPEPAKEPRIMLTPGQAQALGIILTPEQAKAQRISLTPQQAQALELTLTPEQTKEQGISLTPQQAQGLGLTLTPEQAKGLGLTLTPEQTKAQRISLTPQQAQVLGVSLTPQQAQAQRINLTPEQAQALGITLTPQLTLEQTSIFTSQLAQAQQITLTPEEAKSLGIVLTPQQVKIQGISLTPEQGRALGMALTPQQAQAQGIILTSQQAQALGLTLTPQQVKTQRVCLSPEQAQALGIGVTPEQAQALGITLTPQLTLEQTSIFTSQLAQAQQITLTPEEAKSLGIVLTPQQVKIQGISLTPEQGRALGMALTPQQAQAQGIILTSQQAQALGLTLTPQQVKTQRVCLSTEQAQALGIGVTPEQAQALGITLTPQLTLEQTSIFTSQLAQAQQITLTPEEAKSLGIVLTPQQVKIQGISLTPEQGRALGMALTPQQAQAQGIILTSQQAQALGLTLTPQQVKTQRVCLSPEQAQALGIGVTPEQAQALGITLTPQLTLEQTSIFTSQLAQAQQITLTPEEAKNLGIVLTPQQVKIQGISLTPEQGRALGMALTPQQAQAQGIILTSQQAQALGLTLTPQQVKTQRVCLSPEQAQALGIGVTPEQAQALGITLTPQLTLEQTSIFTSQLAQAQQITLTPEEAKSLGIVLTPQQVKIQGISLTPEQGRALGMALTPEQAQSQGIILTSQQAQALGLTLTPQQVKTQRVCLSPEQAQALGIGVTPEQAQALGITLTPQLTLEQTSIFTSQLAQAQQITLTPEEAKSLGIVLTPQQVKIQGISLTPEQGRALGMALTPEQAQSQGIILTSQQAQALGLTLTPQQVKTQRVCLSPKQAQALGIGVTPEQAQALGITLTPQLTLEQTSIFTSQLAQAQQITLTPEEAKSLGIVLTPQQVKIQGISLTPEQGRALGMALTPEQAQAQGIILTSQQAQALGLTLTPQQVKTQRVCLSPEQAQALGIGVTPEQAQALGITLTPKLAQPQEISLSPSEAQALGLTLTPQQAQIQKIFLTPQQAQALGITLTPVQAKALKIHLTPQQAQVLGITLTLEQAKAQRISLTPEQAQVLGITLSPQQVQALGIAPTLQQAAALGITLTPEPDKEKEVSLTPVQTWALEVSPTPEQTHTLGISISPQQAQDLGITLTHRQAKIQKICLTPEQAQALGVTFTPKQAKEWRISLTPGQAQALGITLTPEQAKAHRISLTPGQAEALGITLTPEQAQALGILFTPSRFQTRGIPSPKKFQDLDALLTYEQAAALRGRPTTEQIQTLQIPITPESIRTPKPAVASKQTQTIEIPLIPQLSPAFGIPLPQRQGRALGITRMPGQTQALEQVQALQPPLPSRQALLLGQFGPGETQTLTFTIALEKAQNLGVTFTQEQTEAAAITLTSEQVAALEDALTEELAWKWGLLTPPEKPSTLGPPRDRLFPTSIPLQKLKPPLSQAPFPPRTSLAVSILPDSETLEEPHISPTYRQILAPEVPPTLRQLPTPGAPSTPGLPLGHWHFFKPGDTRSPLMPETHLTHRRPTPPLVSGVPPTSGEIPGLLVSRGSAVPFQPPAIRDQALYLQTYSTPGQPKPSLIIPEQGFSVRTPVSVHASTAEAFPVPGRPQRISPSSVSQKRSVAASPPKPDSIRAHPSATLGFEVSEAPFSVEKIQIPKFSDILEETQVLQDSSDTKSLGVFQPYVTSSRIPGPKSHHVGEKAPPTQEKLIASLPSLTAQLSQTSQIIPSERGQRPRLPPIDEPWILSPVPGTGKARMMGSPVTGPHHEDRYFVDVEAQRKNLALLNQAAQTAGLPSQYHTIARNLIIELLHMNTVRLGYLSRKYVAYRLIQLARNNIIKRLRTIQNTGRGHEAQKLFTMLDRIDGYQKKVMWFWTEKQNQLEQRRKHCLWSMTHFFSQLEKGFKLNLSQPVPLLSGFKQMPDLPKFQRPVLELFIEDKKSNVFKTLGEQAQIEAIWNADLSTSSYPITEKTSLSTLWAQLGGYPDIPRLLELDIQSTFRKSLASIRSQLRFSLSSSLALQSEEETDSFCSVL